MKRKILSLLALPLLFIGTASNAATLNFDDGSFPDPVGNQNVYTYKGFNWINLEEAFDNTPVDWPSNHEAFSKPYALKTINDNDKASSITTFDPKEAFYFKGFQIRTYSAKDSNVTINGFSKGVLQFSVLQPLTKDYILFSTVNTVNEFKAIDTLEIDWGKDQAGINIDDFEYTPVPEPSSLLIGLAGLAGIRRFRK